MNRIVVLCIICCCVCSVYAQSDSDDLRRKRVLKDYVETLHIAYDKKDYGYIKQQFDTSNSFVISEREHTTNSKKYYKKAIRQHLKYVKKLFKYDKPSILDINEIGIVQHPFHPVFYGLTIHIYNSADINHDGGYMFQLWDFTNEEAPKIHVSTWQPDKIGGKDLPKDGFFNLSDFDI